MKRNQSLVIVILSSVLLIFMSLMTGCSEDAGSDNADNNETATATLQDLCEHPGDFDGKSVELTGYDVEKASTGTMSGCEGDDQCCNVVWIDFVLSCSDDDPNDKIVLVAAESASFEEVSGKVVDPDQTWEQMDVMIEESSTRLGCVGQQCFAQCAPIPPEDIGTVVGTFHNEQGSAHGEGGVYDTYIEVDAILVAP